MGRHTRKKKRIKIHYGRFILSCLVLLAVITAAGYALWALNHYFWKGTDALVKKRS